MDIKIVREFKYLLLSIILISSLFCDKFVSAANLKDAFKSGGRLEYFGYAAGYKTTVNNVNNIDPLVGIIIQGALSLLGVIFIALMIYGGFLWMTAKGNDQQVDKAKNLITAAIIGLVIVVTAYAISYLVIKTIGGGGIKGL